MDLRVSTPNSQLPNSQEPRRAGPALWTCRARRAGPALWTCHVRRPGPVPWLSRSLLGVGSWSLGVVSLTLLFVAPPLHAAGRTVSYRTTDGRQLVGLLMGSGRRLAPAVVLVPTLGRSKDDWQAVAQRLADAGITALAIDLPGQQVPSGSAEVANWRADVGAAVSYLLSGAEVASAVGVAGASFGANLAAATAAADPRIRSIALISPTLEYRGVRIEAAMKQYDGRPALLIASLRDPYSARSVRELTSEPPGPREARWSETPAQGMTLLARDPDLVRSLVEWFQRTL